MMVVLKVDLLVEMTGVMKVVMMVSMMVWTTVASKDD